MPLDDANALVCITRLRNDANRLGLHNRRSLPCPHIPHGIHMDSIWIPYNSRWIPSIPYGICFGWDFTHFGHSIPFLFHMEFIWNGHIPSLFHHFIWNINMESTWNECEMIIWIPPGTNLEWSWIPYGFHLIPWNDHGLHRE